MSPTTIEQLRKTVLGAAADLAGEVDALRTRRGTRVEVSPGEDRIEGPIGATLERPPRADFGDYSTNAALLLAPGLDTPPRAVAARLGEELARRLGGVLERFEVAGPGFLNLFLSEAWYRDALAEVLAAGEQFGAGGTARPERILVEFVSANPTGPMHVGHARNAAYGDALARLLALHGHAVTREFYVNDAGSQIRKFGESLGALARGEPVPEDGYHGDYVEPLAAEIEGAATRDPDELGRMAVAIMVDRASRSLQAFRVRFDEWRYETELHEGTPTPVERVLRVLAEHGLTYRSEKAMWLRSTEFGDDKDRVLVRSSGEYTYFASDIAYHEDKRERGYERQIDVWGADHHGYVGRMKAAYAMLGGDPQELELIIMQLVHLLNRGERAQMSKRAGEFVTLEDLVQEIGVDAARWFLLSRSHDTTIDLDLDLAREQSSENPVYYVQYAHARIASMLAKAGERRVAEALAAVGGEAREASAVAELHPAECTLIKRLLAFPEEVSEAAQRRAPHRIAAYALELAQDFTAFYRDCRVIGAESQALESWRIALCVAAQRTIARCLEELLGVGAPAEM